MQTQYLIPFLALAVLAACGKQEPAAPAEQATAPAPTAQAPAAPTGAEHGRIKYGSVCAGCHGRKGEGQGMFPKVAGQSAQALATKLRDYKAGKQMGKQTAMMAPNAQNLSEDDIDALAAYMAGLGN